MTAKRSLAPQQLRKMSAAKAETALITLWATLSEADRKMFWGTFSAKEREALKAVYPEAGK
jgi:hypothetical protein